MTRTSALQDRWKALAPREQNLVLAAATVVALALLWWVAVAPALGTLRAAPGGGGLISNGSFSSAPRLLSVVCNSPSCR